MRQIPLLLGLLWMFSGGVIASNKPKPTNFIIILVDDMGYGDVGYHGALDMITPNIDKLAAEGTYFTQGYVTCSVCGPSRAGLMSGRYQNKFGINGNFGPNSKGGFPTDQPMLQDMLKKAGYTTGALGKWHFGKAQDEFLPWNRNFDYFYGFLAGGHDYFWADTTYKARKDNWPIHRNNEIVNYKKGDYLTTKINEEAVGFIEANHNEPFFLYVAYNAVHYPWSATEEDLARVDELYEYDHKYRRILAAMTLAIDDGVGALMEILEKCGISENTAIFFLSDNGSPATIAGPTKINTGDFVMSKTNGLRGYKGDTYEGGIRVPFCVKWPGEVPAGKRYNEPVIAIDVAPTITGFLGIDMPSTGYDGVNLLPYLNHEKKESPHDYLYWRYQDDYAYREGDWKITWNDQEKVLHMTKDMVMDKHSIKPKLFNIKNDPWERHDLSEAYPEKFNELLDAFHRMDSQMPDRGLFKVPFNRIK
ncbi:sulfatase-like hydrolase/transferase [Carboxylicivirga sediminis]|uniref:Sulfatase-like hydrolase/transferase n=1 Tax=Carboxylicivirga sediminis TaxID=2006564 RepID=A0A941F121_9BACT|nr:sulfatase-like hydrolase/transferase [Carboxylicivirga sediminis]MBR8534482.1 sulfatase-like hydrolase/transferase [Carboxylicivirga sediminis]